MSKENKKYIEVGTLAQYILTRIINPVIRGWLISVVNDVPEADVEEVTRCKDCRFFNGKYCSRYEDHTDRLMSPDDFCSNAEFKE